jgi:asparagine synthase (glutamine-hydrolysing)
LIAKIAQSKSQKNIQTYSVSLGNSKYDESEFQNKVQKYIKSDHTDIKFEYNDFEEFFDKSIWHNDLPLVHPNSVAIYKLSKIAKKNVSILLSGEGADEFFHGYPKFKIANYRKIIEILLYLGPNIKKFLPNFWKFGTIKNYNLNHDNFENFFIHSRVSKELVDIVHNFMNDKIMDERVSIFSNFQNDNYLTDYEIDTTLQELLNRYDRMTMANSIEGRVPFCDHNIVNFAYKLKNKFKIHKGSQKHILKKLSERYLDKDIIYRKKVGFSLPIEEWFNKKNGFLYNAIKDLGKDDFLDRKIVDPQKIKKLVKKEKFNNIEVNEILYPLVSYNVWTKLFL